MKRKGFQLFADYPGPRFHIIAREETTLAFHGRVYGSIDLPSILNNLMDIYEKNGDIDRIFRELEGDFSLLVFDHKKDRCMLGTDRFDRGEIYWFAEKPISFFTHLPFFLKVTGIKPDLNMGPIWDRFATGATTPPETLYKNIFTNVTGEYVCLNSHGEWKRFSYWSPLKVLRERSDKVEKEVESLVQEIRHCFIDKVSQEISPYRRLGVGLSGGMDSAAILGAARKVFDGEIIAVTIGPSGPDSPDLPRARESARFNNSRHIEIYPCASDLEDFPLVMGSVAQPFRSASTFMNHQISKRVHDEGGECVLWGFGADLIFGNAGYCRLFFNKEGGRLPALIVDPLIWFLKTLPQHRYAVGATSRLIWQRKPIEARMAERYFRVCKKPRYYQEKRLFRQEFVDLGREHDILKRISNILYDGTDHIVGHLIEVDFKIVHMYHQVSGAHQICRNNLLDAIITYYNKDYAELNLLVPDRIRAMDNWNKYVLREAFKPLVHDNIYKGNRGACIIPWDRIISGPFREAVIRYLSSSSIIGKIFKVRHLPHLDRMIKHPGLMYLNLLGLALWNEVTFNGASPEIPLSEILGYRWRRQDKHYPEQLNPL
ncbi:MAG: hypothetical protein JW882_03190 [Deltaproteobacteria bacterium]|nr:hypothetical protein [Deltaproteobacteria bacterium]